MIKKIDEYDVRDLRHVDAQNLLQNSESVKLAIERSESLSPSSQASATRTHSARLVQRRLRQLLKHLLARLSEQLILQLL